MRVHLRACASACAWCSERVEKAVDEACMHPTMAEKGSSPSSVCVCVCVDSDGTAGGGQWL